MFFQARLGSSGLQILQHPAIHSPTTSALIKNIFLPFKNIILHTQQNTIYLVLSTSVYIRHHKIKVPMSKRNENKNLEIGS